MIAVCEAARNLSCTGAVPLAITNCLNFGNPYNPEVYWQFVHAIKGMGAACRRLDTPVTGGNVSFYNQSVYDHGTEPVYPTPTIGMVGLLEDVENRMTLDFVRPGDSIYLLGKVTDDIACSEYLNLIHHVEYSPAPYFNIEEEVALHEIVRQIIKEVRISSAHDISEGGLLTSLMESGFPRNLGFRIATDHTIRKDAFLFGEGQGRAVVSVPQSEQEHLEKVLQPADIQWQRIGQVTDGEVIVDDASFGNISVWQELYTHVLETYLEK